MSKARFIATAFLYLLLATPAWAGYDEGMAAYMRGDYKTALRELRPLADQGCADAQGPLGLMYFKGQGVPQDFSEAAKWYGRAAAQGYGPAQSDLGFMYATGRGVPQDYIEAHKWFNLAAQDRFSSQVRKKAAMARDFIAKKMRPAQITKAEKLAREWVAMHDHPL